MAIKRRGDSRERHFLSQLFSLKNKVIVVTGGTGGIGRAIVEQIIAHEGRVAFCAREVDECLKLAAELNDQAGSEIALGIAADICDLPSIQTMMDRTVQHWGRLDGLVANAGELSFRGPSAETPQEKFLKLLQVNIYNNFRICHMAGDYMKPQRSGSIVLVTSHGAFRANPMVLAYQTAKAGENQMARGLAAEFAPHNIRVNCIAPGLTRTPGSETVWKDPEILAAATAAIPLGRIGEPIEQAAPAILLLSDGGAYISGVTIISDGGSFERPMVLPPSKR